MTGPVLVIPDLDREMRVETDASDFVTEGVLLIKCEDEKWRLVVYISKLLNKAERNYKIHNKEMLAIIQYLKAWRYFLEGAKDWFEIWMDHKNLDVMDIWILTIFILFYSIFLMLLFFFFILFSWKDNEEGT